MAFIYEVVPEKDYDFFKSMGIKNFWGNGDFSFSPEKTKWSANYEKNAYLINVGGGHADVPHFHDFWWNGTIIRIETAGGGKGNYKTGVEIYWFVKKLIIPRKFMKNKSEIVEMVLDALKVDPDWCDMKYLKSIHAIMDCEPTISED